MTPDELLEFLSKAVTSEVLYLVLLVIVAGVCRRDAQQRDAKFEALLTRYETLLRETVAALTEVADEQDKQKRDA